MILAIFLLSLIIVVLSVLSFRLFKRNMYLEKKYEVIVDLEARLKSMGEEREILRGDIVKLKEEYGKKKEVFDALVREVAIYNEEIHCVEWGIRPTTYPDIITSEMVKENIQALRIKQKEYLVEERKKLKAVGELQDDFKLRNQTFNMACEIAIGKLKWNNLERIEERIRREYKLICWDYIIERSNSEIIGRANSSQTLLALKLEEVRLHHEYLVKQKNEKEKRAEELRLAREEARLESDLRKSQSEEEKYEQLLAKAKNEAMKAVGRQQDELEAKIAMLSQELAAAHERTERAKSLAEQTRRGHVYVISNQGSFGENVYKIGLTRRLDPQERVDELGDASVPFRFDVHAIIYAEDAPSLERALHAELESHRVNLINFRKEFFKVDLSVIQEIVKKNCPEAQFTLTAEADEYRATMALRAASSETAAGSDPRKKFPQAI